MDIELILNVPAERLDGLDLSDADIIAVQQEIERVLNHAWMDGAFNLPDVVLDAPQVYSHFD